MAKSKSKKTKKRPEKVTAKDVLPGKQQQPTMPPIPEDGEEEPPPSDPYDTEPDDRPVVTAETMPDLKPAPSRVHVTELAPELSYEYRHPACGGISFYLRTMPVAGEVIAGLYDRGGVSIGAPPCCNHCGARLRNLHHRHVHQVQEGG